MTSVATDLQRKMVPLARVDWDDVLAFGPTACELLQEVAEDRARLCDLVRAAAENPRLLSLCEQNPVLTKMVIFEDERADIRLRLHVFSTGVEDRPHNHRWSFSSLILHAGYRHIVYAMHSNPNTETTLEDLTPILDRREYAGTSYSLDHRAVHTTIVQDQTVSLILRGPVRKAQWFNIDRQTNKVTFHGGRSEKQALMTRQDFKRCMAILDGMHLWDS